jgi:uncharacterized protein (TIGR02271 family)
MVEERNSRSPDPQDGTNQAGKDVRATKVDPDTIKLAAEELSVDRHKIETGRVRVTTVTREQEELVDVPLTRERVEVTHVPIGRAVETMPAIRQDGETTIVPVVEEVLVLERRLMLKEELHIKRVRTTERHQESVRLRRQEAIVTRIPAGAPNADSGPDSSTET